MTVDAILALLSCPKLCGEGKWRARCPAHDDRVASLSVRAGERAALLHCFAGCPVKEVCAAIGIKHSDIFYDQTPNPSAARKSRIRKERAVFARARLGREIDAKRQADLLIRSRVGMDISEWMDLDLDEEMSRLSAAYAALKEEIYD